MKLLTILLLVVLAAANRAQFTEWEQFKTHHGRVYESTEHENHRRTIFMENLKTIRKHNFEADLNLHTWYMGINQFGDMTDDEVTNTMTGFKGLTRNYEVNTTAIDYRNFKAPSYVNWVKKGYVNEVVNQGQCGSCYTFSAAATIEGQYKKVFGKLYKFSEQSLIDCTYGKAYPPYDRMRPPPSNQGCNGGWMSFCFAYVKKIRGMIRDKYYKYQGKKLSCLRKAILKFHVADIHEREHVPETELKTILAKVGPLSVAINAGGEGFSFYKHGVFSVKCCSKRCNHAINLVGYGKDKKYGEYWLIRNSWGTTWGDQGYMKVARNKECMCGICETLQYLKIKK